MNMQICIDACHACRASCEICAIELDGRQGYESCVALCRDCALQCNQCLEAMFRGSAEECGDCAEVCRRCAAECVTKDDERCRQSAHDCRVCGEECSKMATAMGDGRASVR